MSRRYHDAMIESGQLVDRLRDILLFVVLMLFSAIAGFLIGNVHPEPTYDEKRNIAIKFMQNSIHRYTLCNMPMDSINTNKKGDDNAKTE
jgi:hypothetical protein